MRRIVLIALAAALVPAAPAGAQAVSTATPNVAGKPTRLHFEVDATAPPVGGRVPSGLAFSAAPGFGFNPAAASRRCTRFRANLDECPRGSRIGSGSLVIEVRMPAGVRDVNVPLTLYLQSSTRVLVVAFLAGNRVVPGVIDRANGVAMVFNPLPSPPTFPDVSYALKHVSLDVGTSRVVGKRKARRRGKRRPRRGRRVHLLTNPSACPTGSWPSTVTLTFPDGTSAVLPAPTACVGG